MGAPDRRRIDEIQRRTSRYVEIPVIGRRFPLHGPFDLVMDPEAGIDVPVGEAMLRIGDRMAKYLFDPIGKGADV